MKKLCIFFKKSKEMNIISLNIIEEKRNILILQKI